MNENTHSSGGVVYFAQFSLLLFSLFFSSVSISLEDELTVSVYLGHERYLSSADVYSASWEIFENSAAAAKVFLSIEESTWNSAINRLKGNKVDIVFAARKNQERESWADFSEPLLTTGSGIYTTITSARISLAEIDFTNAVVGVATQSVQEKMAREIGFKNIYSTFTRPKIYSMLLKGRIDYLLYSSTSMKFFCAYEVNKPMNQCVKRVGPVLDEGPIFAIANKDNARAVALLNAIDKKIRANSRNNKTKEIFARFSISEDRYSNWLASLNKDD
jgi:polar amino acid transport system substrate-binding protein